VNGTGRPIALGTRGSSLALAQASLVRQAFERDGRAVRVVVIETDGDRRAPDTAWGEGAFVAAIERALLHGRIDAAIHSAKDVPTDEDPRLRIGAYLRRADPRDALVVPAGAAYRRLLDLPPGSRVGTDSPRRTGFIRGVRPDLVVHPLHGNVDTRLRRLDEGATDALVLACAGLDRLGLSARIAERLEADVVPPAPGQGAIAIQVRRDDARMLALTAAIDDRATRTSVELERAFLHATGGGCRSPIGALATIVDGTLEVVAGRATVDGQRTRVVRRRASRDAGERLVEELVASLGSVSDADADDVTWPEPLRVLVTRAPSQVDGLEARLREAGLEPVAVPTIAIELDPPGGPLDRAAGMLQTADWVVLTSANGARALLQAAERVLTELGAPAWACIGDATAGVLEAEGIAVDFRPSRSRWDALAAELPVVPGDRAVVVRADLAGDRLARALMDRGAEVDDVVGYRTIEAPPASGPLLRAALADGAPAAVILTSGSTVRGLLTLADGEGLDVRAIPAVCIGPETEGAAIAAGFHVLAVAPDPSATSLAATTADALTRLPEEIA
jgi:hydroxymethylbilane synthase